ncbi:MAG: hypothetical protein ACYS47_03035 [Planctomycetota bacterium]|jgi:hypothetical protein
MNILHRSNLVPRVVAAVHGGIAAGCGKKDGLSLWRGYGMMRSPLLGSLLVLASLLISGCRGDEDEFRPDTTPPSAISDLGAATGAQAEIDLTWTAPGDDGAAGIAAAYVVKHSTSPITESNFDEADTYSQTWTPLPAGTTENQVLTGLSVGDTYYVAVKTRDDAGNLSGISNLPGAIAGGRWDAYDPDAIMDLEAAAGSSSGEIDLAWTATGDDGTLGTASSYMVKYSTSQITASNFDSAPMFSQSWQPRGAGLREEHTLMGLVPGGTYYVAIKAEDEVHRFSPISNVPSAEASAAPDTRAPAAITDLAASTGAASGEVDIVWTAVGDDVEIGTASSYVVKVSTSPITESNFDSAATYNQSWTPKGTGQTESHTLAGLIPGVEYHVAVKALDEIPNASPVSNSPSAWSCLDSTPPAPITDLTAATGSSSGEIDLTWTATGDDGTTGRAASYLLKVSTSPITEADFDQASTVVQTWVPKAPGGAEARTLTGLVPGQTYHLAIKVLDETPNLSSLSNVPSAVANLDITPPGQIVDLASQASSAWGTAVLTWTAVGDDGISGVAASYEARYSTTPITPSNFSSAVLFPQSWIPQAAGAAESRTVTGLAGGTQYYFAVVASDEVPNVSPVSNCPGATVLHSWTLQYPQPQSVRVEDMWGSSAADVFVVGRDGAILHYDGVSWSVMCSGTTVDLRGVWGSSPNNVIAVGEGGTILRYNGACWTTMVSGTTYQLYGVWGSSATDVFAMGSSGVIRHFDGTGWSTLYSGSTESLLGVWGSSPTNVYIPMSGSFVLRYDGGSWSFVDINGGAVGRKRVTSVWGSSSRDVFAVELEGRIRHFNGSSWSGTGMWWPGYPMDTDIFDVWGASGTDVFIVGERGAIAHYDGSSWSSQSSGTSVILRGVWGSSGTDVYAWGDNRTFLHYDGSSWSNLRGGGIPRLNGVWSASGTDVFAVGANGTILHSDGVTWSSQSSGTTNDLNGVWGSSGTDVFAVGANGTVLHYDGFSWSSQSSGVGDSLFGVWGSSGSDVFAVGTNDAILHYDGNSWADVNRPNPWTYKTFRAVWGSSGTDVFVVGDQGTVMHYDGSHWSRLSIAISTIHGVWGSSGSDVFAVGNYGAIQHFNGISWSSQSSGTTSGLYGVWGSGGTDVFVAGSSGTLLHFDGASWSPTASPTGNHLRCVGGLSGNDVFSAGDYGTIVHHP